MVGESGRIGRDEGDEPADDKVELARVLQKDLLFW